MSGYTPYYNHVEPLSKFVYKLLTDGQKEKYSIEALNYIFDGLEHYIADSDDVLNGNGELLISKIDFKELTGTIEDLMQSGKFVPNGLLDKKELKELFKLKKQYNPLGLGNEPADEYSVPHAWEKFNEALIELGCEYIPAYVLEGGHMLTAKISVRSPLITGGVHKFWITLSRDDPFFDFQHKGIAWLDTNNADEKNPATCAAISALKFAAFDFKPFVAAYGSVAVPFRMRYYKQTTSDMIVDRIYMFTGALDILDDVFVRLNKAELNADEVLPELFKKAENAKKDTSTEFIAFEKNIHEYLEAIKEINVLGYDKEQHTLRIQYNNPQLGKFESVICLHPLLDKLSVHIPYYQGDLTKTADEVDSWCRSRENGFRHGTLVFNSRNYVGFRLLLNREVIPDLEAFKNRVVSFFDGDDAVYLAAPIQAMAEGKPANYAYDNEARLADEYKKKNVEKGTTLPAELKEMGVYGNDIERLFLLFRQRGEELFLKRI